VLQGVKPNLTEADRRRWIAESSANFSVQSCYTIIAAGNHSDTLDPNPVTVLNRLWLKDLPSKIGVFGWRLLQNKLATREDLFKKGILSDIINKFCVFCCCISENHNNLFFECPLACRVWTDIYGWLGLTPVNHEVG
jgi:hypothetical protein